MWKPADHNGIPSEEDQIHARRAIAELQMQLSVAMDLLPTSESYVRGILKAIEDRWAWLAPVRRIPFEIFSVIFIMAAEKDWASPASIASVCRFWRDVVLATPQAWSFLNLQSLTIPQSRRLKNLGGNPSPRIASMFLQRSGQHPVHFMVPPFDKHFALYMILASEVSRRIQCLVREDQSRDLVLEDYQGLTKLTIQGHSRIPLEYLDNTRFPNLRYFDGSFSKRKATHGVEPPLPFPHLEQLIVDTDSKGAWLDAIRGCAQTLTALHITVEVKATTTPNPCVDLMRLKHLAVEKDWDTCNSWTFNATTPPLETYDINFEANLFTVNVDVGNVTQLLCPDMSSVDLDKYTNLLQVRLIPTRQEASKLIDRLHRDHRLCPKLECIVVADWTDAKQRQAEHDLRERNSATGVDLKVVRSWNWRGNIHRSVGNQPDHCETSHPFPQCGIHMPCYVRDTVVKIRELRTGAIHR